MPKRPWYPMNPSDYLAKTSRLTIEEHGFYMLMIHYLWIHDGYLPADFSELSSILRVDVRKISRLMSGRVREYFSETSGRIYNGRVLKEITKAIEKSEKAKKSQSHRVYANASQPSNANQQPEPTTKNQDINICREALDYLNSKTGKNYRDVDSNISLIRSRLKDYSLDDLKNVIDAKHSEWQGTEFEKYLRPSTLFNASKFADYAGQLGESQESDDPFRGAI